MITVIVKIAHSTLSNAISNPKYKGYYVGNKVKVMDIFTKKQKFLPPDEWVMYKDETGEIVPAIVDEDLWDRANAVLQRRSDDVKNRQNKCNHANLLTGKLYCAHCGAYYYRKDASYKGRQSSRWVCSGKLKNGADYCESFALNEGDIKSLIFSVFSESYKDANKYIDEFMEMYRSTYASGIECDTRELQEKIDSAERRKEKLLQYNVDGKISDEDFLKMYNKCEAEIKVAKESLSELSVDQDSMAKVEQDLKLIRHQLQEAVKSAETEASISPAFVNKYIDQIIVTPIDSTTMKLDIKLFTGKYLEKALVRSGHMRKKMIEAYENGMK